MDPIVLPWSAALSRRQHKGEAEFPAGGAPTIIASKMVFHLPASGSAGERQAIVGAIEDMRRWFRARMGDGWLGQDIYLKTAWNGDSAIRPYMDEVPPLANESCFAISSSFITVGATGSQFFMETSANLRDLFLEMSVANTTINYVPPPPPET